MAVDESWKQLPRTAALVYVGVLAAGTSPIARAEAPVETGPTETDPAATEPASEAVEPSPDPDGEEEMLPIAPTCGAGCHGQYIPMPPDPPPGPPPAEPSKKGCAIDADATDETALLLGLGLLGLGGLAARRRRAGDDRP